jgi:hypothetical protein
MAKKEHQYDSIIDAFLADREPDWKALDMEDAKKSGDEWMDRAHENVDTDFEDEVAESASKHTPIWGPKSGSEIYEQRIADKEKAQPRLGSVTENWHKDARRDEAAYNTEMGDNDLLMAEVTEDLAKADPKFKENSIGGKEVSDAEILKYVKDLLNQGMSPKKVAEKLEKRAEIELFNHQSATDYLQRNAGLIGLAYLEPNTYMDKNSPTYEHTASANDCVKQKQAWEHAGIKPQAKSVKQVSACKGCAYFKQSTAGKTCNLYHLPVVANTQELTQIVNHLTPGVPTKQKHAALVVLANGDGKRVEPVVASAQTNLVKTADARVKNQEKRTASMFGDPREQKTLFSSEHVARLHDKGVSLEQIYNWADSKFGSIDTSLAFRGFVQSFKKDAKGQIVLASADCKFLNSIGIRNEAYKDGAKCASCPSHFGRTTKTASAESDWDLPGASRVEQKFASKTPDAVRNAKPEPKEIVVTASKVRKLHQAGHSVEKIYNGAASKVGSVQAKKAVAGFIEDMKKHPGKVAVSEKDRAFLIGKLGFKPETVRMLDPQRRPVTQVVAAVPDDQQVLWYPGKTAGEKKTTDGHALLNEYDLSKPVEGPDIDTSGPKRDDVEMNPTFKMEF